MRKNKNSVEARQLPAQVQRHLQAQVRRQLPAQGLQVSEQPDQVKELRPLKKHGTKQY